MRRIESDLGFVGKVDGESVCTVTTTYRALTGATATLFLLPDGPAETFDSAWKAREFAEELYG